LITGYSFISFDISKNDFTAYKVTHF